jgi:SpoVK/Ycf46/Vps4 family AAA+-type ATPase
MDIDKGPNNPPPPPPESDPGGDIKVECQQPELLYKILRDIQDGKREESESVGISNTILDGRLFEDEQTKLSAFSSTGDMRYWSEIFQIHSTIRIAPERQNFPDYGYYSYSKAQRLCDHLTEKGLNTSIYFDWHKNRKESHIFIEKNGYVCLLMLGEPNRESQEKRERAWVEETYDGEDWPNEIREDARRSTESEIEKGLTHSEIIITLCNTEIFTKGLEISRDYLVPLKSQSDFEDAIRIYAEIYEETLNVLYTEEGLETPDRTITFRPPILNQDTFTKLASTETEKPTYLVESQIRQEKVTFKDIAGQEKAVEEAKKLVLAINHPEIYARRGVRSPKGRLFYGPPGTGKTTLAKAIATEANAEFISISSADINNKWYGESERLMQKTFDDANELVKQGKKVILFFDDIDALASSRDDAQSDTTKKVLSILLLNMDGMKTNPNVTIIGATNRPKSIDPAFKRSGRIDKLIHVDLPDLEGRSKILQVHMEKARENSQTPNDLFSSDIDLSQLSDITEGLSGADLANIINLALEDKITAELRGDTWTPVTAQDMISTANRLGILKQAWMEIGFGFILDP